MEDKLRILQLQMDLMDERQKQWIENIKDLEERIKNLEKLFKA